MAIIHNGQEVTHDILMDKWKLNSVCGDRIVESIPYCVFNNTKNALEMLNKHIHLNSRICFHTDVDVDGIGTTYEFKKCAEGLGSSNHLLLINSNKDHGIQQKQVDYFNTKCKIDLMIITDSSSNEVDLIKQLNCDVLCVDHHDLLHDDLFGLCNDGIHKYVIVNNTIENKNQEIDEIWLKSKNITAFENLQHYFGDDDMSCGVVVYELLRLYCVCFGNPKLIENLMLYQWAAVTLYTDVISTLNDRNQWYIGKTIGSREIESTLYTTMNKLNKFKCVMEKSYIGYTFAPVINKAIRAGNGNSALYTIINKPDSIDELLKFDAPQREAIDRALYCNIEHDGIIEKAKRDFSTCDNIQMNVSLLGIDANYTGVIAGRLSNDNHKNAAVYTIVDDMCKGSFRGRLKNVDYRSFFDSYKDYVYAQGHPGAFGFKLYREDLDSIMSKLSEIEPEVEDKPFLTAGNMSAEEMGVYHITDINEFKRLGYLWRIAIGNSRVINSDDIYIRVKACDVTLKYHKGKVFVYDVLGMECKAFEILSGQYFDVYAEFTTQVDLYIR